MSIQPMVDPYHLDLTRYGRYSRHFYGDLADMAERALIDVSDGGNGRPIDDELRYVVFTAVRSAIKGDEG